MEKCLICDSYFNSITTNNIDFYYCEECELLIKKDIVSSTDEQNRYLKHIYDENYNKYMEGVYSFIKPYIFKKNILDFGCGQKHLLCDIINRDNLNCFYYDKYFFNTNYEEYKYDTIILIEVIEHIINPLIELEKLKRLLNSNGRIIILTQLHNNNFNNWWYLRDITHVFFMSEKTVKILSLKLDLKIIKIDGNLIILEA